MVPLATPIGIQSLVQELAFGAVRTGDFGGVLNDARRKVSLPPAALMLLLLLLMQLLATSFTSSLTALRIPGEGIGFPSGSLRRSELTPSGPAKLVTVEGILSVTVAKAMMMLLVVRVAARSAERTGSGMVCLRLFHFPSDASCLERARFLGMSGTVAVLAGS